MRFGNILALNLAFFGAFASTLCGQNSTSPAPAEQQTKPSSAPAPSSGKVIFSRSIDENGETVETGPPTSKANVQMAPAPMAEDSERQAVTFTAFDLDVRLRPAAHQIAIRALLTVRNDGHSALQRVPLQISSSLNWERIRISNQDVTFQVATLNSDSDHTGQLHEAAVPLAKPLEPGENLKIDVSYSGEIVASAQRLIAIGTPDDVALHSDWDQINSAFSGLRGFGNVVWYPVSAVPVILGDGARLFDEIGEQKLRASGAHFRMHLTVEFPHGQAPTIALVNGHPVELKVTDSPNPGPEVEGVATAQFEESILGFEAPSLFAATRKLHAGSNLTAWSSPENEVAVESWLTAATAVTPFLQGWLGQTPRSQLTLLDLPDGQDAPYETGSLLATSLREATSDQLEGVLAHALTHAWMESPRAWLSEGVAHFMGTLWTEKKSGRASALTALEAGREALTLAEPASPGQSTGQPLDLAISPVYYRTKATYVLWMLRDTAGDAALSAALRAYDPVKDASIPSSGSFFESLLETAGSRHDLKWLFADWVNADKGLPDIAIESVFPSPEQSGNWLVAVNLTNTGYASAEIPITVRTELTSITERVLVPGRGKAVQRILIQGKPTEVQVNDGTVPETQASLHVTKLNVPDSPAPSAKPAPLQR